MSLIQELIGKNTINEKQYSAILNRCINLRELDQYLSNMDKQAKLLQKSNLTVNDNMINKNIEDENTQLIERLKNKALVIINHSNIDDDDMIDYSTRIKTKLDAVDTVEFEPIKRNVAYKMYIICGIIIDTLNLHNDDEKTL